MGHDFQQIGGGKVFRPWGQWTEGDYIVGRLSGTSEDNFNNTNYDIEVSEVDFENKRVVAKDKKGEDKIYEEPKAGDLFCLNSCGSLDKAMEKCDIGDMIKVIYTGTITLTKGKFAGKEAHTMKVLRASGKVKPKAEQSEDDTDVL
jgi:hypothetical protein